MDVVVITTTDKATSDHNQTIIMQDLWNHHTVLETEETNQRKYDQ